MGGTEEIKLLLKWSCLNIEIIASHNLGLEGIFPVGHLVGSDRFFRMVGHITCIGKLKYVVSCEGMMNEFGWSDDLLTGDIAIDCHKARLFAIVNDLFCEGLRKENSVERELNMILGDLENYIRVHFVQEERHMMASGYPEFLAHKAKHDEFVDIVRKVKDQLRFEGANNVAYALAEFLAQWLISHIALEDKRTANYIAGKGAENTR